MNIFQYLASRDYDIAVGVPGQLAMDRRFAAYAAMTGGKGFRTPPKQPRRDAQGRTRGDRKRAMRLAAFPDLRRAAHAA